MVFYKSETRYDYVVEKNGDMVIDPFFYSAYQFVRKALIDLSPEDEFLDNINTIEKYYSNNLKLRPGMLLKNESVRDIRLDRGEIEEVEVSPFFFKLMEIFPYYTSYKFYNELDSLVREMDVSVRGSVYRNEYPHKFNFPEEMDYVKSISYKRGEEFGLNVLNVNYLFVYLALGSRHFDTTTNFTIKNTEEYLNKLEETLNAIQEVMRRATPSKEAIHLLLPNAGNEARASFFGLSKPKHKTFEHLTKDRGSRGINKTLTYPNSIEKEEVNGERYMRTSYYPDWLKVEDLTFDEKVLNETEDYNTEKLDLLIDEKLSSVGYNLRLIKHKKERLFFKHSQNIRDDHTSRLLMEVSDSVYRKINELKVGNE